MPLFRKHSLNLPCLVMKKGLLRVLITIHGGFIGENEGGIVILDEIGELSKPVQAKLLTFIEDKYYYKVGGKEQKKSIGLQIIATTNKTPKDDVFRQDFIYRFFPFYIPPLYEREKTSSITG